MIRFFLLGTSILLFANVFAQKLNLDSLRLVAAKTELYDPIPPAVIPGQTFADPPSDAIILFNGKDLASWNADENDKPITWKVLNGILSVDNTHGYGGITTKRKFTDYQLHIEWRIPADVIGEGQTRGNSGVFLGVQSITPMDNFFLELGYELQILDSYHNKTYVNGQAGSIYKQAIPLVNASKKAGEWQVYDIAWSAPKFDDTGNLISPAKVTVFQNGVLIQNNYELKGTTVFAGTPSYKAHGPTSIRLQAHGDPGPTVSYRNIWIREVQVRH